uniref:Uncharacterized protein n=1 Tax=Schistocephalus solidus TaxID=70667 RepID=A0A0X3P4V9_SCHSO
MTSESMLRVCEPWITQRKGMRRVPALSSLLLPFSLSFAGFSLSNSLAIHLTQSFTPSGNILIRCSATGPLATQSVIRLGCTSDDIGICRENCTRPCITRDGYPDCSNKKPDGVVKCSYKTISAEHIEVVYELARDEIPPDGQWWCNFRGRNSQKITSQAIKRTPAYSPIPHVLTSSVPENETNFVITTVNRNESESSTHIFTRDLILIIIIGTIASSVLNLILFIRCLCTRKYIKKISSGSRPNLRVEACLCIQKLAKTYRQPPRRPALLSGSNISWPTHVRLGGRQHLAPMSEPIKRRFAPGPSERPPTGFGRFSSPYLPGQGLPVAQFTGEPMIIEESIYDDVPASSVYPLDGQSNRTALLNQTLNPSPRRARKCIVDAEGTVYVAVGHVSNAQSVHSGLGNSRGNLLPPSAGASSNATPRTWRASQSRLQQRSPSATRPPPARYLNGYGRVSGAYTPLLDQNGLPDALRASLGGHQYPLARIPTAASPLGSSASAIPPAGPAGQIAPNPSAMGTRNTGARGKLSSTAISQSSNVNPPSAFDDQFSEDEEMDDLFSLAINGTAKPGRNS